MPLLSAVLIAGNEEKNLPAALDSVAFCDEVLVMDSGSTDRTLDIARERGVRIEVNAPWPGFVAQRTAATEAARHDWVLALDADERVTPPLRAEIEALRREGFPCAGYKIPRVARYLGAWIRGTDWYPDTQLRLYDRTRGRWEGKLVHESFRSRGAVGFLKGEIEHHPYKDVGHHVRKIDSYTSLWAEQVFEEGRRCGPLEGLGASSWAFVRNYFLKKGFGLGEAGLTVSMLNAYYTYLKFVKLRERMRQGPAGG
ncbi:MAG TPA: glycosyltransferase family 2 protein [Vicinamibacteria bacterium]|jgi:glycosyltransferase involved in cell wall biosynthesis|nr:glycosyltransferase family 2 protein [Vicinamibacteria bacterium]